MRGKVRGKHLMRPLLADRAWRPVDVTDREPVRKLEVIEVRGRQVQLFEFSTPALQAMQGRWRWGGQRTLVDTPEVERRRVLDFEKSARRRAWMRRIKETERCTHCGLRDPRRLEFHHVDPMTKAFNVGVGVGQNRSRESIFAEMEKCVLVCFECHRAIHHSEIDATTLPRFDPWVQEPFPA